MITAELENDFPGTHSAGDTGIHVGNRGASHLEREQLPRWVPIVLAKFVKVIGYLAIAVGQAHIRSQRTGRHSHALPGGNFEVMDARGRVSARILTGIASDMGINGMIARRSPLQLAALIRGSARDAVEKRRVIAPRVWR
jgi:hypothetical protein